MRKFRPLAPCLLPLVVFALAGFVEFQTPTQLDRKQLRAMAEQLGYECKDIVTEAGKEKFSTVMVRNGLDIPVGMEISPSNGYIWLTVNLGAAPAAGNEKNHILLRENGSVQPTQFYISKQDLLMVGLPIENRNVTNTILRQKVESIAGTVGDKKDIWQKS